MWHSYCNFTILFPVFIYLTTPQLQLPIFPIKSFVSCYSHLYCSLSPNHLYNSPFFTSLIFAVTVGSDDLELGASHETYDICLSVSMLPHSILSFLILSIYLKSIWFCFFIAEYYFIVYVYHISITHSLVEEHFGCFHFLAVVNFIITNICGVRCQVLWAHAKE